MIRRLLILTTVLLLPGCGDGDEPPHPSLPARVPLPECPDASYEPCDIRDQECQRRIGELAACVRGDAPLESLPVDVMSEDAFARMEAGELREPNPSALVFRQALASLELAPAQVPTRDAAAKYDASQIYGLYRSDEKRLIVVDHGMPADSASVNLTLLHEFVHALQDVEHDLGHWPADAPEHFSFDYALARKSVVEGEATFYQYRAAAPLLGLDAAQVDLDSALQEHLEFVIERDFDSDAPVDSSFLTFPYAYGALQVYSSWLHGGRRSVEKLWAAPPSLTQAVMSKTLDQGEPQARGVDIAPLDFVFDGAPEGAFTSVASDSLGAWGLALLLESVGLQAPDALATSWRGDRLSAVQVTGVASTFSLWQIELDSPESAQAVDTALERLGNAEHNVSGSRVYVSGAFPLGVPRRLGPFGKRWLSGD